MNEVRQSLGEIPIVEDELRKATGDEQMEDESIVPSASQSVQKLVTADGTYATQSAFSATEKEGSRRDLEKVCEFLRANLKENPNESVTSHHSFPGEATPSKVFNGRRLFYWCLVSIRSHQISSPVQYGSEGREEEKSFYGRDNVSPQLHSAFRKIRYLYEDALLSYPSFNSVLVAVF